MQPTIYIPLQGTGMPVDGNIKRGAPQIGDAPLLVLSTKKLPVFVVEQSRETALFIKTNIIN